MEYQKYIISIAATAILPKEEPKAIDLFFKRFSDFKKISEAPLYLNQDGYNEMTYLGRTSKPLEKQEIEGLEAALAKENRTLKIFRLDEIQ